MNFTPFENPKQIQQSLNSYLGPELVAQRSGPGGTKVTYLEGWRVVDLANLHFGFNGWSSQIMDVTVDYFDNSGGKVCIGISCTMRITLKDGTIREDIGYGSIENAKSKALAFEKAKKEAVTDGLKRTLKSFGKSLGNCLYDKEYIKQVGKGKAFLENYELLEIKEEGKSFSEATAVVNETVQKGNTNVQAIQTRTNSEQRMPSEQQRQANVNEIGQVRQQTVHMPNHQKTYLPPQHQNIVQNSMINQETHINHASHPPNHHNSHLRVNVQTHPNHQNQNYTNSNSYHNPGNNFHHTHSANQIHAPQQHQQNKRSMTTIQTDKRFKS